MVLFSDQWFNDQFLKKNISIFSKFELKLSLTVLLLPTFVAGFFISLEGSSTSTLGTEPETSKNNIKIFKCIEHCYIHIYLSLVCDFQE